MLVRPIFSDRAPVAVAAAVEAVNIPSARFTALRKGSGFVIEKGATVYTDNGFYDVVADPEDGLSISAVSAVLNEGAPFAGAPYAGDQWQARFSPVSADIHRADLVATIEGKDESLSFYVGNPPSRPAGVYPSGVQEGQTLDLGAEFTASFGDFPAGDTSVDFGLWRLPSSAMSTGTYTAGEGLPRTFEVTSYGDYEIRATYQPSGTSEVIAFSVPAPSAEPFQTSLSIPTPTAFEGDDVRAFAYVDHLHAVARVWLDVDGVEHERPTSIVGGHTLVLPALPVGTHSVTLHVELSDTVPTLSASQAVSVTINAVPVETLLDAAKADPTNQAAWQAVIDSPQATARQKLIAEDIHLLNQEISTQAHGNLGTEFATNDRAVYAAEELGKANPKTFSEWWDAQQNWGDPVEFAQARALVAEAPVSSFAALLSYWNQPLAYGSLEFELQNGIGYELNLIKAGIGEAAAFGIYQSYQSWIAARPNELIHFIDFARYGPP